MSCLFNSLAPSVNLPSQHLRQTIAEYLETDPVLLDDIKARDVINWTEGEQLVSYTERMKKSWMWGGAIEIKAFCELFSVHVTVHVLYTGNQFTIETSKPAIKNVHISYTGSHFEPMYTTIL